MQSREILFPNVEHSATGDKPEARLIALENEVADL